MLLQNWRRGQSLLECYLEGYNKVACIVNSVAICSKRVQKGIVTRALRMWQMKDLR